MVSCIASVVIYDNDLEYEWSRDRENDGSTLDARIFSQVQFFQRIITLRPMFLYCSWQLMWWFKFGLWGVSTLHFISKRGEVQRKLTESVTI
jgi:hypothetical protein